MRSTFHAALLSALFLSLNSNAETQMLPEQTTPCDPHPYIGMWVTADGYIRLLQTAAVGRTVISLTSTSVGCSMA
jgi:hypothetical protein